jgi:hypothetical protein
MRKNLFVVFMIFFGFINFGFSQQIKLNPNIKNESNLRLQAKNAPNRITDVIDATYCYGTIDEVSMGKINKIGISKNKLKELVQCTAGDFDRNEYLDFVIWGIDAAKKNKDNIQWPDGENYVVLFFEKSKIIRTKKIKTSPGFYLVHYPPRTKKGINGEPVTNKDALWTCGDNDGYDDYSTGKVYLFDSKTENFKIIEFGKK